MSKQSSIPLSLTTCLYLLVPLPLHQLVSNLPTIRQQMFWWFGVIWLLRSCSGRWLDKRNKWWELNQRQIPAFGVVERKAINTSDFKMMLIHDEVFHVYPTDIISMWVCYSSYNYSKGLLHVFFIYFYCSCIFGNVMESYQTAIQYIINIGI